MKRTIVSAVLMLAIAVPAFGHGKEMLLLGTVKDISATSITLDVVKSGGMKTIAITGKTKFLKSGAAASWKELKAGDRVSVTVDAHGKDMEAMVVKFGAAKPATAAASPPKP